MDREERLAHLRLIRTPNIGPMTFSLLLQRYGSATAALRAVTELAKRGGRSLKPASRAAAEAAEKKASEEKATADAAAATEAEEKATTKAEEKADEASATEAE